MAMDSCRLFAPACADGVGLTGGGGADCSAAGAGRDSTGAARGSATGAGAGAGLGAGSAAGLVSSLKIRLKNPRMRSRTPGSPCCWASAGPASIAASASATSR
ncbi:MAG: hypothetical protein EXR31_02815 [Betaproteobacteria bacterium]|nr:hypothetical protein [Betaproteobacteria bacterium]